MDPMFPGSSPPTTIGGAISTATSATLAAMSVNGLPLGTVAWNVDVGAFFKLTASTAALDPDVVVAVKDTTGSRWILMTQGLPTPDQFFAQTDFTSVPLVAPATTMTLAGLTGNADGDYEIYFYVVAAEATGALKFQINGADTNLYSTWSQVAVATLTGNRSTTTCEINPAVTAPGDICTGWIKVRSKTGVDFRTGTFDTLSGTGPTSRSGVFTYTDVATEITSVSITAANADSLGIGSYFTVRKLFHQF